MKKLSAIILCLILSVALYGCTSDTSETAGTKTTVSVSETTVTEAASAESEQSDADTVTEDTVRTGGSTAAGSKNTDSKSESASDKSSQSAAPVTTSKTATTAAASKQTTKTTAKATTAKQTTPSSIISCTVTVECKSILNNTDSLKAGHEAYVPSDGYIINGCTVTVDNGSTVYDAVKAACNRQGVSITASSSSYGIYVAGFNNIDEKDCGSQSGWLYQVNGNYPSKSCGKYILSNGDNVIFTYTCS